MFPHIIVIFRLLMLSRLSRSDFASSCSDHKVTVVPVLPGDTVELRCNTLHTCTHWLWKKQTDRGLRTLTPGTCMSCDTNMAIFHNKTERINILVVYNASDTMKEQYTCSCKLKIPNSSLFTIFTVRCYRLIAYNSYTTDNMVTNYVSSNTSTLRGILMSKVKSNQTFQNFLIDNLTANNFENKPSSLNVTKNSMKSYNHSMDAISEGKLACQLKIEVNQNTTVCNATNASSSLVHLIGVHVGDKIRVMCHHNASFQTNCQEMKELSLFIVKSYHDNCQVECTEANVSSNQPCYVGVALQVNRQYISSAYETPGTRFTTESLQQGSRPGAIVLNIPVSFFIVFAGFFGFLLLLIILLVIYVFKINWTTTVQSHITLNEDQPAYNDIVTPFNESNLQRISSRNHYVEKIGLQGYVEMKPISRNAEVTFNDNDLPVYDEIPDSFRKVDVQMRSSSFSNKRAVTIKRCLGNTDSYGCSDMIPKWTVDNTNTCLQETYQDASTMNNMDPTLYRDALHFTHDLKDVCKVHPYSYME